MADLFANHAADWDQRPIPQQISEGVYRALDAALAPSANLRAMDFGAGTGLVSGKLAPRVREILAVDVSPAMLEQLAAKPDLQGKVKVHCQDLLERPLEERVDLVVSAMAFHHVEDTAALVQTLYDHLVPGGRIAVADLDAEDGSFHPPDAEGVHHAGFDRPALAAKFDAAGFRNVHFETACEVHKEGKTYPIFLVTADKPA